jgi:hypothetical protein
MKLPKLGTLAIIDSIIVTRPKEERKHLGASLIGSECERQVWYSFKHPKKVTDARLSRIFELGNIIEEHVLDILHKSGFTVYEKTEDDKQFRVTSQDGELQGSIDGVVQGIPESDKPHVLEIKSYNDKRFKTLSKETVRISDYKYYVQMQVYMHYLKLDRALFVAYNKNDSDIYIERIDYDETIALWAENRARKIYRAQDSASTDRCSTKSTDYRCRFCNYATECWNNES